MTQPAPNPQRVSLAGFAEYLANQGTALLEQWLLIVRRDTQIETADRLPQQELVDHLPRLLRELCAFVRARDADILTGEARRDATTHGELRWQDGYKVDELLRELEALRQLLTASAFRYRELHPDFKGTLEVSAHALIQQFFAEITVASARQFMNEQQNAGRSRSDELATARQELGRANRRFERLRNLLQRLPQTGSVAGSTQTRHSFVEQLVEYAQLCGGTLRPQPHEFDPRALFSEIVAAYKPAIEAKGLRLLTDCVTAPALVQGDRAWIRRLAEILLDTALHFTTIGQISFEFGFSAVPRWAIIVSATSPGTSPDAEGLPDRGIALALAEELVSLLGGSLNTQVQSGVGVRIAATLPRGPANA